MFKVMPGASSISGPVFHERMILQELLEKKAILDVFLNVLTFCLSWEKMKMSKIYSEA
jgi:hypothetical protein